MSSCYKTSNNKYFHLPPRMQDGRHFTDYRPNCVVNNHLKEENKISSTYEYRMFLTQNAKKIMNVNKKISFIHNGSYNCKEPYNVGTMLPEKEKVLCNLQTCDVKDNYDDGLGLGREHTEINKCIEPGKEENFNLERNLCVSENKLFDGSLEQELQNNEPENDEDLENSEES